MKRFSIEKVSTLKNNGQACEQDLRYALTNRIEKPDNRKGEADVFDIQVKSARATLCKGTNLEEYVYNNEANRFAYVTAERIVYIMNKDEFYLFAREFATVTTDSAKNGGSQKMRLRYETPAMLAWLENHASEEQPARLFVFDEDNKPLNEYDISLTNAITKDEEQTLCVHYIQSQKQVMLNAYAKEKSDERAIHDIAISEIYDNARGYIVFNTAKKSKGILEKITHEISLEPGFLKRLCEDNDRRAFFGNCFDCALVKEADKAYLVGISFYEYDGSEGIYYDWYPKKHAIIKENKRVSLI